MPRGPLERRVNTLLEELSFQELFTCNPTTNNPINRVNGFENVLTANPAQSPTNVIRYHAIVTFEILAYRLNFHCLFA